MKYWIQKNIEFKKGILNIIFLFEQCLSEITFPQKYTSYMWEQNVKKTKRKRDRTDWTHAVDPLSSNLVCFSPYFTLINCCTVQWHLNEIMLSLKWGYCWCFKRWRINTSPEGSVPSSFIYLYVIILQSQIHFPLIVIQWCAGLQL